MSNITGITLTGNFRPEWNQLVDSLTGTEDEPCYDADIADCAREFVEAVQAGLNLQMMDVYVVMEWGDDYHGSRPVRVFTDEGKAKACARDCQVNQLPDCGSETCDHRYRYLVHKTPMDKSNQEQARSL